MKTFWEDSWILLPDDKQKGAYTTKEIGPQATYTKIHEWPCQLE